MEFNFQPFQLIFVLILVSSAWILMKSNVSNKIKIAIIVFLSILTLVSPVRFKQPGFSNIEQMQKSKMTDQKLPERKTFKYKSFESSNKDELIKMKKTSKEMKDEIHN